MIVKNHKGELITGTNIVSTGSTVALINANDGSQLALYTVILFGDVTGEGIINQLDFVYIKRHVWGISELTGAQLLAASISSSNKATVTKVTSYDFVLIKRHVWNIAAIVQPE